ncbi:DUF262 domain-containing protein [Lacticaseibacillus absianus]|uniref:DUF262 domain-containing protein n=1 Tax=Lacticaseibacillus absianus TaxID=2729623 RepID=UPI0015CCB0C4|nr:DUF262 domain-containing protein [Lacticaseibacillus absianus]
MTLFDEYTESVKEIRTDAYSISIGEIANMYKENDLIISPEYQRYFRWEIKNKSDFIESILLGIPIPSLFVSQDIAGTWDVIDGLQRISTILEFMGILRNPEKNDLQVFPSLELVSTKFLPSLQGKTWDKEHNIGEELRRIFKRRKLSFIIVDGSNNNSIKYELFQRLNTNGLALKPQEIRNVSVLMSSRKMFESINEMNSDSNFQRIYKLTTKKKDEQEDKDAVSAFVVMQTLGDTVVNSGEDISSYLTERLTQISPQLGNDALEEIKMKFREASLILASSLGDNAFQKWSESKNKYYGPCLRSIFEVLFPLVANNLDLFRNNAELLVSIQKGLPTRKGYKDATKRGTRAIVRFSKLLKLSEIIADESKKH